MDGHVLPTDLKNKDAAYEVSSSPRAVSQGPSLGFENEKPIDSRHKRGTTSSMEVDEIGTFEDSTFDGFNSFLENGDNEKERGRKLEREALLRMNGRLKSTLKSIRGAKEGMKRLEENISQSGPPPDNEAFRSLVGSKAQGEFKILKKLEFLQFPSVWGHAAAAATIAGVFYILLDIFVETKSSGEKFMAALLAFLGYWCTEILKALYYN